MQANAIPHQSSIMRDRRLRNSLSARFSGDQSPISRVRWKGVLWPREMPHELESGDGSDCPPRTPNIERRPSIPFQRSSSIEASSFPRPGLRHRSPATRTRTHGATNRMSMNVNKPFPPLPRRPERSRFSLPVLLHSIDSRLNKSRRTNSLSPPAFYPTSTARGPRRQSARPDKWKQLPTTPSLTHLDGSIESPPFPRTPSNNRQGPSAVRGRARTRATLPVLPHHPIEEFSKRNTIDDLYDDYFDLQFAGMLHLVLQWNTS